MNRRSLLALTMASVAALGLSGVQPAAADEGYRVSGPHVHGNLAVYFVHGKSAPGPAPLTLQEAVAQGAVRVHETGNVNELQVENLSDQEVFVQSGDIVKGGKQDRVLMVSLVLSPKSGRIPIASFCVEQGRWSQRAGESVGHFASADTALPSRKAKLAMKAPIRAASAEPQRGRGVDARPDHRDVDLTPRGGLQGHFDPTRGTPLARGTMEPRGRAPNETSTRQAAVWKSVAETQSALAAGVGHTVQAPQSQSSLQLSLENQKLKDRQAAFIKALAAEGEKHDDVVGYVFAIGGKVNSGDVYPSNALFKKMWGKLLKASVTEAIGENESGTPPTVEQVMAFLQSAEGGEGSKRDLTKAVSLETREGEKTLYFATNRAGGGWVHRNYLAK